jgi:hypothetical protein
MKTLTCIIAALALAAPLTTYAQNTTQPLTRAQVRADLVQLEKAGYRPSMNDPYYPQKIQAAEAKVQSMNASQGGYGGSADGTASGRPAIQGGIEAHSI